MPAIDGVAGPGFATYALPTLHQVYQTLTRVYKLGVSLPDAPLNSFKKSTAHLPRTTEAERLTIERVGQSIFRDALLEYWNGRCPLTGITEPALLRASHIVPWAECENDALRLDVHNGLLLFALWDAAFDCGLVSFADDGSVLRSPVLTGSAVVALSLSSVSPLTTLTEAHRCNLARHRVRHGYEGLGPRQAP
jgi:predicted restriction endonuclease